MKIFLDTAETDLIRKYYGTGLIDGITTNPNQKMLALLIILLINLSVFLAIANIGKAYLKNAGIL